MMGADGAKPIGRGVTRITPRAGWPVLDVRELWDYRELLYFLVWRDIKVRYKQTVIGAAPAAGVLLLPIFLLLAVATALGAGLWLSVLNAMYRDVRYVVPFLIQLWLFASPVVYPSSLVPEAWRWLYGLNPMAGVIEGFRRALLGQGQPPALLGVSAAVVALVLLGGVIYFSRAEETIADIL